MHVCMDMDQPLVPGHRVAVGLRTKDVLLDCVGAGNLDGTAAPFVPPPRQQLLTAVHAFRFMDNQLAFNADQV